MWSNSWEHLYRPHRKTLSALPEFASENFCTAEQYVDWLLPGEIKSETDLAKGAGAIIKKDGKPVAVYKDEAGNVHRVSGVCPHLYGVVQWNEGEKSWDCPCHGSRFNVDGCLLNTPAISDLSKKE